MGLADLGRYDFFLDRINRVLRIDFFVSLLMLNSTETNEAINYKLYKNLTMNGLAQFILTIPMQVKTSFFFV